MRGFTRRFVLLIGVLSLTFLLDSVRAEPFGLVVQDPEIAPAVAKTGELVSVNIIIRNTWKNTTSCNVTAFCGDCVVGVKRISAVAPNTSISMFFLLNTSNLSTGVYSVEVSIKKPSGEQKIFDLGTIAIEQEDLTTPEDVTEPLDSRRVALEEFEKQFSIEKARETNHSATVLLILAGAILVSATFFLPPAKKFMHALS